MSETDPEAGAETAEGALAERPEPERLALEVARAKVASALFAETKRVELGRYQLLERAGAGGMGVVWSAWDPELERRVAIKVMHARIARARERVREEGQALAKLSHPNVVPIYDVGVVDEQVYLVMEWVSGATLRAHCAMPRTVRELVALYRAAGEGLLAAHSAGLIHRDFKPENVMVGEDGRVRVLDFGIALAHEDAEGAARAGTPRYMPEEQANGGTITAAVDQYAFCVALREALAERTGDGKAAAVPPWLDAIVARGAARVAADRYPSMAEVLRALARDPRAVWRTRLVAGGAVALAGAAFAIGTLRAGTPEQCTGSAAELARSWNDGARAALLAHVQALGAYGADEAPRMAVDLDGYGKHWIDAHHGACTAHEHGELTPALYQRELACLANARAAFQSAIEVATRVPADRLPDAVVAERALPAVEHCATDAVASKIAPPSPMLAPAVERVGTELARAHTLILARDPEGPKAAAAAVAEAEQIGYRPLVARAQLEDGLALSRGPTVAQAVMAYERSTAAALQAGDDVVFVEAFARELFAQGRTDPAQLPAEMANTAASVRFARRIAERTGTEGAFARALLYNNAGTERLAAGDRAGARTWFLLAIDEQRAGARGVELAWASSNLALTSDDPAERARLLRAHTEQLERDLGPHHAFTLQARRDAAMFITDPHSAISELGAACADLERWRPEARDLVQQCHYELGWLAEEAGDVPGARAAMAGVSGDDPASLVAPIYVRMLDGDRRSATADAESAGIKLTAETMWWQRFWAVDAFLLAATGADALGDPLRATADLRKALAIFDDPSMSRTATFVQRRLARVQALLARHLVTSDPKVATALAASALAWSRAAGGYDARVAELAAITAGSGSR